MMQSLVLVLFALFFTTAAVSFSNDVESDPTVAFEEPTVGFPELDSTSQPLTTSSSAQGLDEIGVFDPHPYPVLDSYSQSKTVKEGDMVEFECKASDAADHLPHWPKHDLELDLIYENDKTRDLTSPEHGWWADYSKSTKSRPSHPKGRIDITETAEVYLTKQYVKKSDEGWYRCRACINKDTEHQACDVNLAKFYLHVLKADKAQNNPVPGGTVSSPGSSSTSLPIWGALTMISSARSSCQVFGDPHVVSFDGSIYNLPGSSCDYVLALDQDAGSWFIYGRMRPCGHLTEGVCLESVTIYAGGDAVELQRGWIVNHKGKKIETAQLKGPIKVGELEVEFSGSTLIVSLLLDQQKEYGNGVQDWLKVYWDGLTTVTIEVPQTAQTQGLCGDNDQDPLNDWNVWGTENSNLIVFSESLKVDRNWKCDAGTPAPTMDQMEALCGAKKFKKAQDKCAKIFGNHDFENCVHDKVPFIDACVYDQCKGMNIQNDLYPWMVIPKVDKVLLPGCNAAEAYAMKCSMMTWDAEGDVIAAVDMPDWEVETKVCATKSSKLQNIPKLGCPQSFQ